MDSAELVIRESVRQTLADYTAATDRFDLRALAGCFADEGVLEFSGGAQPLVGREAIATGLAATVGAANERPAPSYVRHHVSSVRFATVCPDRVEVSSYFAVHTDVGVDHWGRYRDVVVPVADCWLFARRRIAVDGFSPASLMRP